MLWVLADEGEESSREMTGRLLHHRWHGLGMVSRE